MAHFPFSHLGERGLLRRADESERRENALEQRMLTLDRSGVERGRSTVVQHRRLDVPLVLEPILCVGGREVLPSWLLSHTDSRRYTVRRNARSILQH